MIELRLRAGGAPGRRRGTNWVHSAGVHWPIRHLTVAAANPAVALQLQCSRPVGRIIELESLIWLFQVERLVNGRSVVRPDNDDP